VEVSKRAFPRGAGALIIATGRNWPDALGGSGLSLLAGGPLLLVEKDSIPPVVANEISRLDNKGWIQRVYILGGEGSVSKAVELQLRDAFDSSGQAPAVIRLSGVDRYATADRIAGEITSLAGQDYDGTALVATGLKYADALSASPLAAARAWPLFLVPATGVSDSMLDAMAAKGVRKVVMLGSRKSLPQGLVEDKLAGRFGVENVTRLSGGNRYTTALAVAEYATDLGMSWNGMGFAKGTDFPDGLCGGVLQGAAGSVMLLTSPTGLDPAVEALIRAKKSEIHLVRYFGSTSSIPQAVRDQVARARQ
jgi:putative cell wall-binding protein